MVELSGVSKGYVDGGHRRDVLRDVNARIDAGQVTALTGRSGSGKSTVLNLVSGIDLPDSGVIRVDGLMLTGLGDRERTLFRRRSVGFVFQFFNLIPTLTVEENLLLPLELIGRAGRQGRERVRRLLARVELAERRASYPDALSGGEQQRVAVVRALVHEPALILADEPTGNLDAETGSEVLELLTDMVRSVGATLIMVTHSPEAAAHADRCLRIEGGALHDAPPS